MRDVKGDKGKGINVGKVEENHIYLFAGPSKTRGGGYSGILRVVSLLRFGRKKETDGLPLKYVRRREKKQISRGTGQNSACSAPRKEEGEKRENVSWRYTGLVKIRGRTRRKKIRQSVQTPARKKAEAAGEKEVIVILRRQRREEPKNS